MEREVALARGKSGAEDWMSDCGRLFVLASSGQSSTGQENVTALPRTWLSQAPASGRASGSAYETGAAVWEAFFGNAPAARQSATAALQAFEGPRCGVWRCVCAGRRGDSSRAKTLADDLERRFPGGYVGQIQLPAGPSARSRSEPWRACRAIETVAIRPSL